MSVFANNFSSYLNYTANYTNRLTNLESIFKEAYETVKDPNFISVDFLDKIGQFPKFPYFMSIMSKTNYLKIPNIYNVSLDRPESLLTTMLESNITYLKSDYDTVPNEIENILRHANFQYTYLSTVNQIYDVNKTCKTTNTETSYRNFFTNLYSQKYFSVGYPVSAGFESSCSMNEQALISLFSNNLSASCSLTTNLLKYILYFNALQPGDFGYFLGIEAQQIKSANFQQAFDYFIINNKVDMSGNIIDLISKSLYNYNNLSTSLKSELTVVVEPLILGLSQYFTDYLNSFSNFEPNFDITSNFIDSLYYLCSVDLTSLCFKDATIMEQANSNILAIEEDAKFTLYMNKIDSMNIQDYLFLVYLYKFWPLKFVNVLQMVVKEYIQNIIKTVDIEDNAFDISEFTEFMGRLYADTYTPFDPLHPFVNSKINYTALDTFIQSIFTLTPDNYLWRMENTKEVSKFACELYYIQLIDNFMASEYYIDFTKDLLKTIFEYLRDNGHVSYLFNWYNNHEVVDIFIKTFLRYRIFSEDSKGPGTRLFHSITANFKAIFDRVVTNTTGEPVYDISITYKTPQQLNDQFKNLVEGATINRMYQFNENLYLSSLTCESFYAILGKFFS